MQRCFTRNYFPPHGERSTSARRHPPCSPHQIAAQQCICRTGNRAPGLPTCHTPAADGQRASTRKKRGQGSQEAPNTGHRTGESASAGPCFVCLLGIRMEHYMPGVVLLCTVRAQRCLFRAHTTGIAALEECQCNAPTCGTQTKEAGSHHLTCICTPMATPRSVSVTTRQLGPFGMKEWPGRVRAAPKSPNTGLHLGFRSHAESAYVRKSAACADTSTSTYL
ncbi:hypothetical protein V8C42DRAFT_284921 [Trichoderma barbatum]